MSTLRTRMIRRLGLAGLALAALAAPALSQQHQHRGGMQSWNGGPSFAPNWQGWAPGVGPGSFGFGMASVSIVANGGGGVSVNIANLGSAASYYGGMWRGGYVPWAGFSAGGMNALALSAGGGGGVPGGVSIGIANVALFSGFTGFGGHWAPRGGGHHHHPRPQRQNDGGDSGDADSGGGDSSGAN